ncbi:MAG: type II 3-dehydroquinate dehydratase [Microbacteriaceae bacterium]
MNESKVQINDLSKRVLLLHGPNLNLLGEREPAKYGTTTLAEVEALVTEEAKKNGFEVDCFQSNHEGDLIDKIHEYRHSAGIILNPGALVHYSIAIYDAIAIGPAPTVEIHITNLHNREPWRAHSAISGNTAGYISGFGIPGYKLAVLAVAELFAKRAAS